jgi:two-component system response regulator
LTLRALERSGLASDVNGAEALHHLFGAAAREASRKFPDLILLDLKRPKLGGHEVLK